MNYLVFAQIISESAFRQRGLIVRSQAAYNRLDTFLAAIVSGDTKIDILSTGFNMKLFSLSICFYPSTTTRISDYVYLLEFHALSFFGKNLLLPCFLVYAFIRLVFSDSHVVFYNYELKFLPILFCSWIMRKKIIILLEEITLISSPRPFDIRELLRRCLYYFLMHIYIFLSFRIVVPSSNFIDTLSLPRSKTFIFNGIL